MNSGDSPDIAGGVVTGTLADNKFAPDVFGCKVKWQSAGNALITLDHPVPAGRGRCWVNILAAVPLAIKDVAFTDDSNINVRTYLLATAAGPVLTETPTKFAFCFGVSVVPEG